jgi:hypothetical protein
MEYSGGCIFFALYAAALIYIAIKGSSLERRIFLPQALMLLVTVYNPFFPLLLNRFFDVNNEYYRFFWIAPAVILDAYVMAKLVIRIRGWMRIAAALICTALIISGGKFLYAEGYIKSPNIYKMPTEIPVISEMIHSDAAGRYDGDYYPRAICEFDYEMCLRQYDASIMLACTREQYLTAITGQLDRDNIFNDDEYYSRLLAVVVLNLPIDRDEFRKALEMTGTEYVCVTTANTGVCSYLEDTCGLRLVGNSANHSLYHYELEENEGWRLPSYQEVWDKY